MRLSSTILIDHGEKSCWMLIDVKKRKIDSLNDNNDNIVKDSGVQDKLCVFGENNHKIIINDGDDDDDNNDGRFVKRRKIK
ncbi:ORF-90 peptide [Chrysodeixis chalcites nucleopolyhedrovirus]|uniref:ORF-90 peptide n=1 Tax=Chrysodeixis chalcites nucleopolyhedrovirus TaxID=320432 RepID=Q4KSZ0_9ABAC|nr:ORF-90 peptide [Chrysodeixis chalcites nucleopolyhedrovirus]AGC36304.1 hypothetical protein TF1A_0090 [Chrysodeixis chalcites SNPV TF1-A]AAY84021.1 ORF-90 peptide [Chrysodeixis chalcites nucleopolyhedrovirus]AGE61351.1 hypothetical protein [Chrysodeixis chalcites nucleopolyhedrovirus]AGE61496.1 hypothetical protein [Chrysodeixis chalcites nucleopolyhedrovirus]AGE61650.1 hypothetical protein [Chrysodeixis chalcites nucleopolyhedrovirus]